MATIERGLHDVGRTLSSAHQFRPGRTGAIVFSVIALIVMSTWGAFLVSLLLRLSGLG